MKSFVAGYIYLNLNACWVVFVFSLYTFRSKTLEGGMKTIAIIGAGLSGLTLAAKLKQSLPGVDIQLFEKARGPGGRMSTRRAAQNGIEFSFDHGAQFFTARSGAFREFLSPYINEGIVAPWQIDIEKENVFVGAPAMNAICKSLASGLNVRTGAQVQDLTRGPQGWILDIDSAQAGPFDLVVSSAPAPQTSILFEDYFAYQNALAAIQYQPCFALMLCFATNCPPLDVA